MALDKFLRKTHKSFTSLGNKAKKGFNTFGKKVTDVKEFVNKGASDIRHVAAQARDFAKDANEFVKDTSRKIDRGMDDAVVKSGKAIRGAKKVMGSIDKTLSAASIATNGVPVLGSVVTGGQKLANLAHKGLKKADKFHNTLVDAKNRKDEFKRLRKTHGPANPREGDVINLEKDNERKQRESAAVGGGAFA